MDNMIFKRRLQQQQSDSRVEDALKDLGRSDNESEWTIDDRDLEVDLNELFSE